MKQVARVGTTAALILQDFATESMVSGHACYTWTHTSTLLLVLFKKIELTTLKLVGKVIQQGMKVKVKVKGRSANNAVGFATSKLRNLVHVQTRK